MARNGKEEKGQIKNTKDDLLLLRKKNEKWKLCENNTTTKYIFKLSERIK
jgi:hypothetical protein